MATNDIDPIVAALVLTRWLHFASLFVLFGCSSFWRSTAADRPDDSARWSSRIMTRIVRLATLAAAMTGVGWLVISVAMMTGSFADMVDPATIHIFVFETPFGAMAITRLILLLSLVTIAFTPMTGSPRFGAIALVSGLLMMSQAWLGHAAEGGDTVGGAVMIAAYAVHLLSAAAWVGSLPGLALVLIERRRTGHGGYDVLARYSAMAVLAAASVILSGIANTAFHVGGGVAKLPFTSYGIVLFAKIALVMAMLVIAAINRFRLMPRLRAAGPSSDPVVWMRTTLALELVLATLVLGAAAVLGIIPPPH